MLWDGEREREGETSPAKYWYERETREGIRLSDVTRRKREKHMCRFTLTRSLCVVINRKHHKRKILNLLNIGTNGEHAKAPRVSDVTRDKIIFTSLYLC